MKAALKNRRVGNLFYFADLLRAVRGTVVNWKRKRMVVHNIVDSQKSLSKPQHLSQLQKPTTLTSRHSSTDEDVFLIAIPLVCLSPSSVFSTPKVFSPSLDVGGTHSTENLVSTLSKVQYYSLCPGKRAADIHFLRSDKIVVVSSDHHTLFRFALQQLHRFEVHGGIRLRQTQEFAGEQPVKVETG
jgi:hypothetical protein